MTSRDDRDRSPQVIHSSKGIPIKSRLGLKHELAILVAVIIASMILGYVLVFNMKIPQYLILIFISLVSASIFIILFAHILMIKLWGLRVYENHFKPPHKGLYILVEESHNAILFKDIDIAFLHRSHAKNRSHLKIELVNGKSIVIRQGDFGIESESFEALIKQIDNSHKLNTTHFRS